MQDDDSDDEAELKAELERIRGERAAEAEKRAAEEEAKRQEAIRAEVLGGNPLMANGEVDFGMKRRWVLCVVGVAGARRGAAYDALQWQMLSLRGGGGAQQGGGVIPTACVCAYVCLVFVTGLGARGAELLVC